MGKGWTQQEVSVLIDNYTHKGNKDIAVVLGRTAPAVKKKMQELGLKRSKKQLSKIRSVIARRPNLGQFTSGHVPHNTKYDGHERITSDGYIEVRLEQGCYRLKHLHLWEQVNGSLPKGYCLRCVDGDKLNTTPGNWRLVTRIENMYLNSKYRPPVEVIPAMVAVAQLDNLIKTKGYGKE